MVASEPGIVSLDGVRVGRVLDGKPLTLDGLAPGWREVEVRFDAGGSLKQRAKSQEGRRAIVTAELSDARVAFRPREGVHFGVSVGPFLLGAPDPELLGGGAYLEGLVNIGLAPAVDIRIPLQLGLGTLPTKLAFGDLHVESCTGVYSCENLRGPYPGSRAPFAITLTALAALRLNATSIWGMSFGFRAGAAFIFFADEETVTNGDPSWHGTLTNEHPVAGVLGPEGSLASFRFGAAREWELEWAVGALFAPASGLTMYHGNLMLHYLFLP